MTPQPPPAEQTAAGGVLRGADGGSFEAAEGRVDPEVQPGLHGVVLVVRPDGEQHKVRA